jgi:hypothetical protein
MSGSIITSYLIQFTRRRLSEAAYNRLWLA